MSSEAIKINKFGLTTPELLPPDARPEYDELIRASTQEITARIDLASEAIANIRRKYRSDAQLEQIEIEIQKAENDLDIVIGKRMNVLNQEMSKAKAKLPAPLTKPDPAKFPVMAETRSRLAKMPSIDRENYVRASAKAGNADIVAAVVFDPMPGQTLPTPLNDALLKDLRAAQAPDVHARISLLESLMQTTVSDRATGKAAIT